ncbi:NAD(P)-dependent oxidoreductase [Megamonas rupellensis]|uniref:NAD-dependent epimerase/dehydratase family protein n=1 Tax=Megamonas rupellensis TaxID=491921 RepID=UPI00195E5882|nr:NAD(P)-dependent oxidoreductase [Megamonas rupellensis]MBM6748724.1 NAD(P)-dependent oxidoreductase [Megamonas rupellensis]
MKNILITGATSFIGSHLINILLNDYKIFAVIRPNSKKIGVLPKSDNLIKLELNMDEYYKITDRINDNIDVFIHFAWAGTRGIERNNKIIQEDNYRYSMMALKSAIDLRVKTFITAGSQAEYGPWVKFYKQSEDVEAKPNTEYGKIKLKFYERANVICNENKIRFIEPRFFSLYGPGDFEGTMVISILKKMLLGIDCDLTEGIQKWDFLYIDDAVLGLKQLIENTEAKGIYNFGYGESHLLKEYIQKMYEITKSNSKLKWGIIPYPKTGIVNINPCVNKLKSIGWTPKVTFDEGIKEIIKSLNI